MLLLAEIWPRGSRASRDVALAYAELVLIRKHIDGRLGPYLLRSGSVLDREFFESRFEGHQSGLCRPSQKKGWGLCGGLGHGFVCHIFVDTNIPCSARRLTGWVGPRTAFPQSISEALLGIKNKPKRQEPTLESLNTPYHSKEITLSLVVILRS